MIINCDQCGKEVYKKPSQLKRSKNNFCSLVCSDEFKKKIVGPNNPHFKSVLYHCDICNKEFYVQPHIIQQKKDKKRKFITCSVECKKEATRIATTLPRENRTCPICDKIFEVKITSTQKYCSTSCSNKNENRIRKINLLCDNCQTPIQRIPYKLNTMNHHFCSKQCADTYLGILRRIEKVKKVCIMCGIEYEVYPNKADVSITCSRKCQAKWQKEYCRRPEVLKRLRKQGVKSMKNQGNADTKPERITEEWLKQHNILYEKQKAMYDKFIVDFYLPKHDMVLEVWGDYWHGNPRKYGNGVGKKPKTARQKNQYYKDQYKKNFLEGKRHLFASVWEYDIYHNVDEALRKIINI